MRKRVLSLCMALAMCLSLLPIHVSAGELKDIAQSVEDDEAETPETTLESVSDDTKTNEVDATGDVQNLHTITGVQWDDAYSYIKLEQIISLDEVQTLLPTVLSVYLDKDIKTTTIPVSWEIESKVVQSTTASYNFRPVLSGYMDTDVLPCIHVEMGDESSNQSAYLLNGGSLFTDDKIQSRIDTLYDLLGEKFFTVNQGSCTTTFQGGHSCNNCYSPEILKQQWFKSLFGTLSTNQFPASAGYTQNGWSCLGFAHFAEWYIFRESDSSSVTAYTVTNCNFNFSNISQYAKIGDLMRLGGSHSVIFISADSNGIYVLDCNGVRENNAQCKVRKHTIPYSWYSTVLISRAPNSAPPDPNQHTHQVIRKNSSGVCVRELQEMLNKLINAGLDTDGNFGPATESKLKEYQRNAGLTVDGVCGAATWAALERDVQKRPCADVGTDFCAYIINTTSWLHLTNDGDGNVTARTGENAANQIWRFERLGNGAYKITSLIDSNQCLDVANFGQTSGTNVGIANANGGSAQQWFIYGENGAYAFRAECTNCVMDITNSNYVSGVNVQMWESNGTDAQKFQIWNLGSPSKTLDINWMLDGNQVWGEQEYGTVDVYINGVLDADDVTDYCKEFPMGTRYEITDIKARDGHISQGVHSGSLSGMLVHDSVEVWISFATLANLGVNGWLDGQYTGGLGTDAFNYATVDVYINGELKADDVSYYYVGWPVGTTYEIKDIKANPGYSYVGIHNGTLSGTIGADHANVAFDFATVHYLDLSSYLDEAYSGNLGDYGTVDVYVNGVLVKDDVTDYYAELPVGTTYEIKDVKPRAGCSYNGIREGTRTGSIGSENVAVVFDFSNIQTSNLPSASKQETFNGHTYKFYSDAVTWYTAKLLCESMGGHLVTITSKEEDQFIKSFSDGKYAHIGATDANSEGHWEWVTGEPFSYENWIAPPDNYPINDEGCENYTHLRDDGLWNDFPGYITYPFICEFDSVEPTQFVIAYDSNGGSGTMSHGLATEGIAYTLPENAFTPPEDKQFKAWGIGDEEYSPGSSYTFTANSTVRAIWENASNSTSQIMIGNQSALKGATLEIPVTIKNNPGIAGATLTVSYDESALTLNDIIKGALFENGSYSANSETGVVQWYHTENVTDDGVLFTLQFAVNGNAQNGSYTIAVGLRDGIPANLSNADSNIVTVQFVSGILEITSGIRGDVTGDGVVAINDVVKLARAVAGSLTLTEAEIAVADVTGDGVIAINDVVKLARHVAGNLASLQSADNASLLDGESAVISIETYSGMPGETVQIPVSITQNPGIAGMQMDILFDSGLTLKNIIRGAVLSAGTFNPDVSNGRVQWYYEQANVTDIGVLFTLEFEVNAEARSGAYAVAVNLKDGITANLSDYDFNSVSVDFTSGKVQITGSTIDTAINTVSRSGNTITANVVCADSNASVFCAVYNNSGKMIAVRSAQITSESNYQFQFDGQQFDYAKAFIVDSDFRPLCESKES